jgi:hypothetical protein
MQLHEIIWAEYDDKNGFSSGLSPPPPYNQKGLFSVSGATALDGHCIYVFASIHSSMWVLQTFRNAMKLWTWNVLEDYLN